MTDATLRSRLFKARLRGFTRVLRGVEQGDQRAVHRTRVASRRLRELIPVLELDAAVARKLSRRLRRVTKRLGAVREFDVLSLLIDELHVSRPAHRDALRRVGHIVARQREEARKLAAEQLTADHLWRLARKLDKVLQGVRDAEASRPPERRAPARARTARWVIDARVAHRAARLAAAIDSAGSVYLAERLHDVRVALKKLRYALELAADAGTESAAALRTLRRVQTLLGRMHDLQELIDCVRETQASLTPPNLGAWRGMDALVVALDEACRRLHARYLREREPIRHLLSPIQTPPAAHAGRAEQRAG